MIRVNRLPVDPGPSGWNQLLPDQNPAQKLEGALNADWLIVGAGFAGLAAARRLSQLSPESHIVVLEARRVGEGPAGRNSGFMVDLPHNLTSDDYSSEFETDKAIIADNRLAIDFACQVAEDANMTSEAFSRSGKINAAASERGDRHNKTYADHLALLGEECEHLDQSQMQSITGTNYYSSGLFTPGTAIIQPAMFVREAANLLRENHVVVHEFSPVLSLDRRGSFWFAKTPLGQVSAQKVILAVNGHLNSFGFFRRRLCHIFTYASMTRALSSDEVTRLGGKAVWAVTPADPLGTSVRRISGLGGDRIVIRNRVTFDPSMEVSSARLQSIGRHHNRAFNARFPMLGEVAMEFRWGGRLCLSLNDVQVINQIDDGLYSACVQNGLGTVRGTLAGVLAAELAIGIESEALKRALEMVQPRRLPPWPIARLGAMLRIEWGQRRAGMDL